MRIFLDSSVVLAGCGRATGASRGVIELAATNGWELLTSAYSLIEIEDNLQRLGSVEAIKFWQQFRPTLTRVPDALTFPWITTLIVSKDRPILFTAAASAKVLLTLDRKHFQDLLGKSFYTLEIMKPGSFLERERASGRLK